MNTNGESAATPPGKREEPPWAHYTVESVNAPNQVLSALLVAGIIYSPVIVSHKYVCDTNETWCNLQYVRAELF